MSILKKQKNKKFSALVKILLIMNEFTGTLSDNIFFIFFL